eukprot:11020354-Alexandrium_andersonii.AAC.1
MLHVALPCPARPLSAFPQPGLLVSIARCQRDFAATVEASSRWRTRASSLQSSQAVAAQGSPALA